MVSPDPLVVSLSNHERGTAVRPPFVVARRHVAAGRLHVLIKDVRRQVHDTSKKTDAVYESPEEYVTDVED